MTPGNGSGTHFQASQCISMRSNLTLSLTLEARCAHSLREILASNCVAIAYGKQEIGSLFYRQGKHRELT